MTTRADRRGYALVLVIVFMVLLLSLASVVYRQLGASLRVESIRTAQAIRDEGCLRAAALGLSLLETGLPPTNPYECGVTIETSLLGPRSFTVTMTSDDEVAWTVHAAPTQPGDSPEPMPLGFAPAAE